MLYDIECELAHARGLVRALQSKADQMRNGIRVTDDKQPQVTDHAVIRYMERKMGLDVDGLRNEILGGRTHTVNAMQRGTIKTAECYTLVIENGRVVTVL